MIICYMSCLAQLNAVHFRRFNITLQRTLNSLLYFWARSLLIQIERLQNVHLRRAFEAQKKQISDKNMQERAGAGEKLLYHGTTLDNCDSIMKTGFNRSFAGQNGNKTIFFVFNQIKILLFTSYQSKRTVIKMSDLGIQMK